MEKFIKLIKTVGLILPGILIIYLIVSISGTEDEPVRKFEPGKNQGLTSYTYDKHNNVSMVVKSSESFPADKGTRLKDIEIKKIKKNKELGNITVTGKDGFISLDMSHITVTGDAKIVSKNMTMESPKFTLKAQNELTSTKPVKYYSKKYDGVGKKGASFYFKQKMYKFIDTEGTFMQEEKKYNYKTDILWFWDERHMVIFEKNCVIDGKDSRIESDKLDVFYTEDRKYITRTASHQGSRMVMGSRAKGDYKEIKGNKIDTRYPHNSKIDLIHLRENGEITIIGKKSTMFMRSDDIKIRFSTETGRITRVEMLKPGSVKVESENPFTISASMMFINFKGEDITDCTAEQVTDFSIDEYSGSTPELKYDVVKKQVLLKGNGSRIFERGNRFTSSSFFIDTDKKILSSRSGVKSVIHKKSNQKKSFLSSGEIMVNAGNFTIDDKNSTVKYGGNVRLMQEGLNLKTSKLKIPANGDIIADGSSSMSFSTDNNETILTGNRIFMDAENNRIYLHSEDGGSGLTMKNSVKEDISESSSPLLKNIGLQKTLNTVISISNYIIRSSRNKAKQKTGNDNLLSDSESSSLFADILLIVLDDKRDISFITGRKNVKFDKGKISGSSRDVKWYFKKERMLFSGNAALGTKEGSSEKGDILELRLDKNLIITRSRGRARTETLIK